MDKDDRVYFDIKKARYYNFLQSSSGSPIIFTGELLYRQDFPDPRPKKT